MVKGEVTRPHVTTFQARHELEAFSANGWIVGFPTLSTEYVSPPHSVS